MRNIVLALIIAFAFGTAAMAGDIAISTEVGWFNQAAADRESQEIVDNVTAVVVELFPKDQQAALADWVVAHTGDGQADLLILMGRIPASIYPAGNAEPDGSLAELFLDDGNIIVNTGDYMFYVTSAGDGGNNAVDGLKNMMDLNTEMWDDNTGVSVTADGQVITPSLVDYQTDRPFHLNELAEPWYTELVLAQNAAGTRADPVIVANMATGGRIGIFYQTNSQDDDPRGEVMSEWINNWYLTAPDVISLPTGPNPADGAIEVDTTALEWTGGHAAVKNKVYLSSDATIDDADLLGETDLDLMVAVLDPGATYYWRVDGVAADDSVTEGPVWSFTTLPLEAHFPDPVDGATNAISLVLSWTPGKNSIMHNVHYGTDPAMLLPVQMMSMETSYDPGALDPDTTYYWRVDEFGPAGTVPGPVWSFSTISPVTPSGIPDLIAQYEFEEGDLTLAALDSSGNDHHGPLLGDASISGGVLSLDGDGDAVDCGLDPSFHPAGSFSISTFVNMHSWGGSWGNAIAGTRGESGLGWQLRRHSGNSNLTFTIRGTTGADDPQGSIVPPLNEWIHVAAVYDADAGTRSVYINGNLDVQIADTGTVASSDHNLYIGARANGDNTGPEAFFNGDIDSLLIYNRALMIEEIRVMAGVEALPWNPVPTIGSSNVPSATVLSWNPGDGAILQDIYFGTDAAAVADANTTDTTGIYQGRQPETTFAPDLASDTTYYWRVDQMSAAGLVAGPVWSFSTARSIPAGANLGAATSDVPGFEIYTVKAQTEINNFAEMNEILDTGLMEGLPPVEGSEEARIDEFVNLRDTGNGAFGEDKSFPGIDALEVPANDPADGDDDEDFATEVVGCIQLTAGVHTIGANSDDGTIVWVGGVEIGRSEELKGASNRDFTFEVVEDGFYTIKAHHFERGGGASLELHEILADGTRLLLNDTANGGSAVFAPAPVTGVPELVAAFAFGSRQLDCATYNDPSINYTMVLHDSVVSVQYDAARGYGYEVIYPTDSPFGDRSGYGVLGPFDDSPNNRNEFGDDCPEQIYDSFIGAKDFTNDVNEATMGGMDVPSPNPEGIIFRVDVPNGVYRFVAAVGEADNTHAHRILAEDGGSGPPENIGANYVVLVHNHDQAQYANGAAGDDDNLGDGSFARVGFAGLIPPEGDGIDNSPAFVDMGYDGKEAAAANSPTLEVNQGYIRIHQLQGNSNDGPGGSRDPNGGDIVILELWKIR